MTVAMHPAQPRTSRRERLIPPLDIWRRTLAILSALTIAAVAYSIFAKTPLPAERHRQFFQHQFAGLDRQKASIATNGQRPHEVVFIGTSRLKNVAFDAAAVRRAARRADVH